MPLGPAALFSETQARAFVTCTPNHLDRVMESATALGVPLREVGETGERLDVGFDGGRLVADVEELRAAWSAALPKALGL